jgi:predicted transcriptional regulator
MPEELKEKIKELISQKEKSSSFSKTKISKENLTPEASSLVEDILTILEPYYYKGQRQFFVLFVSGLLRRLGVPEEIVLEKLKAFCEDKKDEEISMRVEAIKYTYKKSEEEITGLRGLKENLGVKEEDFLRLKALIRKYKGEKEEDFKEFYGNLSYTPPRSGWEILNKTYEPPKWLLEPFLPEGITVIGGKYKIGKSFFALQITCELALRGKRVLHYGLEDTEQRLNLRLKLLFGDIKPEFVKNIFFRTKEDKIPRIDRGGLKYLKTDIQNFKPDLVVIDPFLAIKPRGKGKDIPLEDYESIQIFRDITDQKINILIIHHSRKTQAEDISDELAGSGGFLASPDNIGVLKRDRHSEIGYFSLYPRDFETQEWALAFNKGKWELLGKKEEIAMAEEQKKIISALKELGGEASPKEVASFLNKNYHTTHNLMIQMVNKGILKKTQRGKYSLCDISYSIYSKSSICSICSKSSKSSFGNFTISPPSYSKSYSNFQPSPNLGSEPFTIFTTNTINITQKNFLPSSTSLDIEEFQAGEKPSLPEEEDYIYLLVPSGQACAKCKAEGTENRVFKFTKEVYDRMQGIGTCLRCGNKSLFFDLWSYRVLTKEEIPWFQYYRHSIEAKATIRISKDGKVEIEGGKIVNPEIFQ